MSLDRRLTLLATLAACSGSPGGGPSGSPSVSIAPAWIALLNGDSTRLTAIAIGPQGDTIAAPAVSWSTASSTVADVNSTGMVHARALGYTTVTVTFQGRSAVAGVAVTPNVLVGAGDIANCALVDDSATATLLDTIPGVVFAAGDNAYSNGTTADYTNCYAPTWGRHKTRTRPTPGNHEYNSGGGGYYSYFGRLAGDSGIGYYSYDFARWHIVALNSNFSMATGSAQEQWLRADLAAHPTTCALAYWHHPRFSSGTNHGSSTLPQPLWQALFDAGADVIVVGHEHHYERFAPQQPNGTADPTNGIRQFVVGTGGAALYPFGPPIANSEVRNNTTHGVIKLTLNPAAYAWRYITTAGAVADSGSGSCH